MNVRKECLCFVGLEQVVPVAARSGPPLLETDGFRSKYVLLGT